MKYIERANKLIIDASSAAGYIVIFFLVAVRVRAYLCVFVCVNHDALCDQKTRLQDIPEEGVQHRQRLFVQSKCVCVITKQSACKE